MSYLGSKAASGVYQKIIAEMPPHDTYIETHLGGGAVMLRKPPAIRNIGIDIDVDTLKEFAFTHQLPHVNLINRDAVDYLEMFDFSRAGRVLVYSDPPYLPETRTSRARYRHEYTVADHERLLTCLLSLPENVSVILKGKAYCFAVCSYCRLITVLRLSTYLYITGATIPAVIMAQICQI